MRDDFPVVMVAPLNWGLGHATRCMPLIDALVARGIRPVLGSDGGALALLREEYPDLVALELPAYDIEYRGSNMILTMGAQLPKIGRAIMAERREIGKIVRKYGIKIIISDNRYGVLHPDCQNIFMTHQLNIKIPNRFLEKMVATINRQMISRFDQCWVPDYKVVPRLAGSLSENPGLKMVKYTGPLSRMRKEILPVKYKIAVVLSGPEPQRSNLENILLTQLKEYPEKVCFVRGLVSDTAPPPRENRNISIHNFLTADALNRVLNESEIVICRSGYSSLMDLVKLNKRAILIPTPGQTEQEYLAEYLSDMGGFITTPQRSFDLEKRLIKLEGIDEMEWPEGNGLEKILEQFINYSSFL